MTKRKKINPPVTSVPPLPEQLLSIEEDWNEQALLSKHDYILDDIEESY